MKPNLPRLGPSARVVRAPECSTQHSRQRRRKEDGQIDPAQLLKATYDSGCDRLQESSLPAEPLTCAAPLLASQRDHGVDAHGAARRNAARSEGHESEQDPDSAKDHRVGGRDSENQTGQQPSENECEGEAD